MVHRSHALALIYAKGFASIPIPFENCRVVKAGIPHAYGQPPSPSEKLDATHPRIS
jgi:hypothetical protein